MGRCFYADGRAGKVGRCNTVNLIQSQQERRHPIHAVEVGRYLVTPMLHLALSEGVAGGCNAATRLAQTAGEWRSSGATAK